MGVDYSTCVIRGKDLAGRYSELDALVEEKYDTDLYDLLYQIAVDIRKTIPKMPEISITTESAYGDEESYLLGMSLLDRDGFDAWVLDFNKLKELETDIQTLLSLYWDYIEKNYPDMFEMIKDIPDTTYLMSRVWQI